MVEERFCFLLSLAGPGVPSALSRGRLWDGEVLPGSRAAATGLGVVTLGLTPRSLGLAALGLSLGFLAPGEGTALLGLRFETLMP